MRAIGTVPLSSMTRALWPTCPIHSLQKLTMHTFYPLWGIWAKQILQMTLYWDFYRNCTGLLWVTLMALSTGQLLFNSRLQERRTRNQRKYPAFRINLCKCTINFPSRGVIRLTNSTADGRGETQTQVTVSQTPDLFYKLFNLYYNFLFRLKY